MKKTIILAFLAAVLVYACQQENEEVYSCDKRLNEWAHKNLKTIRSMDREKWLQLDEDYKAPAFNALTPDQKMLFWKDKLKEVMTTLEWNEAEMRHLAKLYQYLEEHPDLYTEESLNDSIQNDAFARFAYQWENDAMIDLNWTEEQIYAIANTGNRMTDRNGTYTITLKERILTVSESGPALDCNCSTKRDSDCTKGDCKGTWGGTCTRIWYNGRK